ncbi:hypothetical protein [Chromobacterium vaccinii]|nr:hypothetical protein [Chromobacterium vaccinii]
MEKINIIEYDDAGRILQTGVPHSKTSRSSSRWENCCCRARLIR